MTDLLAGLRVLALQAGEEILAVYATDFQARTKDDASPVTEADERAEAAILPGLAALTPDIPIVSEEEASKGRIPQVGRRFWLVDPLDGTKEFLKRNGEFTVNIGLIEDGQPVAGVVYAPVTGALYLGGFGQATVERPGQPPRPIAVRPPPAPGLTVVGSRSHADPREQEWLAARFAIAETKAAGSSLKFCLVAAGEADLYARLGPTMEWDTAAGHAVLRAAGGSVTDTDGQSLAYGKPDFRNPGFVARGGRD